MQRPQLLVLIAAALVFAVFYWGFDTKPAKQQGVEKARTLQAEATSVESLLEKARTTLTETQKGTLSVLEAAVGAAKDEAARAEALRKLSSWWYQVGQWTLAASVAADVAELEKTDAAWSIAGASYYEALTKTNAPEIRDFAARRAVKAFENAASLAPNNPEHRVNLALVYAENPQIVENPMQAVMMLRELEKQYPESPAVYNALGRLAIKTNQWERAIQRLEKAWSLDNKNPNTPCLLAKAYEGLGNAEKTTEWKQRCRSNQ